MQKLFSDKILQKVKELSYQKKTANGKLNTYILCPIRKKEIRLSAEEKFRQLYLQKLIIQFRYSEKTIKLEFPLTSGSEKFYADIVIFEKENSGTPYIIADFSENSKLKARKYLSLLGSVSGAPILIWANETTEHFWYKKANASVREIQNLPTSGENPENLINPDFTLNELNESHIKQLQKTSLKAKIKEIEDEVLANAGVDVFMEVFKLIFIKLYDEWLSINNAQRFLEFRQKAETQTELLKRMNTLLAQAITLWKNVFPEKTKLNLSASHLAVCISSLQNIRLLTSKPDFVDDAFEYLINKSNKGEKGQYFTPRHVIEMCIKMMNPKISETVVDTAAGSGGFSLHTFFYVCRNNSKQAYNENSNLFSQKRNKICVNYARNNVFALDFDEKTIMVARALLQIIAEGEANVLNLNTLDYERRNENLKKTAWKQANKPAFDKLKMLRTCKTGFRDFNFDLVLTNPPFGGIIKEARILHKYKLAEKKGKTWHKTMSSDILFIERNLQFLKPGGRMAIILPQGRFNNSGDTFIRDFIAQNCRILAVVSLHENTFKPHTGTKTSVLFLQKWTDKSGINPPQSDYNIFFAVSEKPGKDNGGDKVYVLNSKNERIFDQNGNPIIDHDLFSDSPQTGNCIAEQFIEFAKKERLSFV